MPADIEIGRMKFHENSLCLNGCWNDENNSCRNGN